jgi:type IV pilus assembly protein PilE
MRGARVHLPRDLAGTLRAMRRNLTGVTLIELMIAVVVISVLAAIAVPAYRLHLVRAQRSDATEALLRIQAAQEKSLVRNGRYTADLVSPPDTGGLGLQRTSERGFYKLNVTLTRAGYVATASAIAVEGGREDGHCRTFTINETGRRSAVDRSGTDRSAECWR